MRKQNTKALNQFKSNTMSYNQPRSFSIYIPRIASCYTSVDIAGEIQHSLGTVERVDIVNIGQKPGFKETTVDENRVQFAAFVHMSRLNQTDAANNIFYNFLERGEPYMHYINFNEYWIILKNLQPVRTTFMNIHQVTDNCRQLEERVEDLSAERDAQQETILMQRTAIEKLEGVVQIQAKQIDRIQETIYQLLGETLDVETEFNKICGRYNYMMFGNYYSKGWLKEDGTEYEEPEEEPEEEEDNDSSTHSSMPSLISISSEEDDYNSEFNLLSEDLQQVVSVLNKGDDHAEQRSPVTIPVTERLRNTSELCGNN